MTTIKRYGTLAECLKVVKCFQKRKHRDRVISIECSPLEDSSVSHKTPDNYWYRMPDKRGWLGDNYRQFSPDQYWVVTMELAI